MFTVGIVIHPKKDVEIGGINAQLSDDSMTSNQPPSTTSGDHRIHVTWESQFHMAGINRCKTLGPKSPGHTFAGICLHTRTSNQRLPRAVVAGEHGGFHIIAAAKT